MRIVPLNHIVTIIGQYADNDGLFFACFRSLSPTRRSSTSLSRSCTSPDFTRENHPFSSDNSDFSSQAHRFSLEIHHSPIENQQKVIVFSMEYQAKKDEFPEFMQKMMEFILTIDGLRIFSYFRILRTFQEHPRRCDCDGPPDRLLRRKHIVTRPGIHPKQKHYTL